MAEHKTTVPHITGLVHLANVGDVSTLHDGWLGTKGEKRQMEGFQLSLSPHTAGLGLEYMCHAENVGDMPWVSEGKFQGSRGASRRIEGISVRLTGPSAPYYEVFYQAHLADRGDSAVSANGAYCGTKGESRRIEAIKVWIVQTPTVSGLVHIANRGDVAFSGSAYAGTKGEKLRVEAFTLQINPAVPDLGIEYTAHQQDVGDRPWVSNGALQGTRGESKRLEGFAVRLTGARASQYVACYQAHIADQGDSAVVENGAYCGTKGLSRQIEGIRVWTRRA